jgi:hypothetical protein
MRALIACALLAGCITAAAPLTPPQQLYGCWSNGGGGSMRWSPDATHIDVWRGVRTMIDSVGVHTDRYSLEPEGEGWRFCSVGDNGRCWSVARGAGGSLEGGRAFIDGEGEGLQITIVGDGPQRAIFQGHRSTCL